MPPACSCGSPPHRIPRCCSCSPPLTPLPLPLPLPHEQIAKRQAKRAAAQAEADEADLDGAGPRAAKKLLHETRKKELAARARARDRVQRLMDGDGDGDGDDGDGDGDGGRDGAIRAKSRSAPATDAELAEAARIRTKLAPSGDTRKYVDSSSMGFLNGDVASGRGRFAEATAAFDRNSKWHAAREAAARKPKSKSGFKSAQRFKRR